MLTFKLEVLFSGQTYVSGFPLSWDLYIWANMPHGAPQGCDLRPPFDTLDCVPTSNFPTNTKFANDTVVWNMISNKTTVSNRDSLPTGGKHLEIWFQVNNQHLNITKAQELKVDFGAKPVKPTAVSRTLVERMNSFRYLDNARSELGRVSWPDNVYTTLDSLCTLIHLHHKESPERQHHFLVWEPYHAGQKSPSNHTIHTKLSHLQDIYTKQSWTRKTVNDLSRPTDTVFWVAFRNLLSRQDC